MTSTNNNVAFKIQFGDEIRRIALATRPSFDELRGLIAKLFAARQLDVASFVLKYVDDEGDHVTMGSDLELECAINAIAGKVGTLRLIVSVPAPVRGVRHCHNRNQPRAQPQPAAPAPAQPQQVQQVFEFLKSFGCPSSDQILQKIEAFMSRVPEFKSADQFISEAIAEAEKLLANPDVKALLPFPIQPENVREFIAPFLENPFVQQTITTFFETLKQARTQPAQQPTEQQPARPCAPHPFHHFQRRMPMFNPGNGNPNEEIHFGVACDGCQSFPLRGTRHRCTQCPDYDLCQSCLDKGIHKETAHVFKQLAGVHRPQVPFGHFGRCGRRRGVFFQEAQQQQAEVPVKAEEPAPAPVDPVVAAPEPVVEVAAPAPEPVVAAPEPVVEEVISPEEVVGLEKLASMGFLNREVNLNALRAAGGDLWEALQIILQQ